MVKHGSLTRAGKVRKQTPKVEPKDRLKKILVGRSKKRKQFQKKSAILVQDSAARKKFKPNAQAPGK
jgi:small subunit ribosomal protein S30e